MRKDIIIYKNKQLINFLINVNKITTQQTRIRIPLQYPSASRCRTIIRCYISS